MNDKIATAFLMALAGALVVGILYIVFAPIPEEIGAGNSKEAERIRLHSYVLAYPDGSMTASGLRREAELCRINKPRIDSVVMPFCDGKQLVIVETTEGHAASAAALS
jgi:hypothetical protein